MPPVATLLQYLRRRRGSLTDYAALVALIAVVSIGALLAVGDRSRCILADAGRAALGLDPQGCALADGGDPNIGVPVQNTAPTWITPSGNLGIIATGEALDGTLRVEATDADAAYGDTLTYTLVDGALPAGVSIDPATGVFVGTPTDGFGVFSFTLRATDRAGAATPDRLFSLITNARPTIDVAALTGAVGNLVRNQALSIDLYAFVSDADGQTLVLSHEGTLPANMSLVNGVLSGTPTLN